MNKKRLIISLLSLFLLCIFASPAFAIRYYLGDFEKSAFNTNMNLVNVDGRSFLKTGIRPDLKLGPVDIGFDLNLYLPTSGGSVPSDLQAITLRRIGYDHEKKHGFKWGHLSNITFGYGLLMDQYDSGAGGTTEFTNEKAGFLGYTTIQNIQVKAMYTGSSVAAGRVTYTHFDSPIMNLPVIVGATYVKDNDGINKTYADKTIRRNAQEGIGADIGLPVFGDLLTVYTEYVSLKNQGKGNSTGFKGDLFFLNNLNYRFEYRSFQPGFVPGYFNSTYEATNFDFDTDTSDKNINGFLGAMGTSFLDDYCKADLIYENYEDREAMLTAAFGWRRFRNTVGVLNYTLPFNGRDNATLEAEILYITGGLLNYVFHGKRTYVSSSRYIENWNMGVRVNLESLFPQLPFSNVL